MKTCAFVVPPNSPLQRAVSEKRPKIVNVVSVVLVAHVVFLTGFLIQGCNRTTLSELGGTGVSANSDALFAAAGLPLRMRQTPRSPEPLAGAATGSAAASSTANVLSGTSVISGGQARSGIQHPVPLNETGNAPFISEPPITAFARTQAAAQTTPDMQSSGREESDFILYVVRPGDTLARIAKTHGTSVKNIELASQLQSDKIFPGQKLRVPPAVKSKGSKAQPSPELESNRKDV